MVITSSPETSFSAIDLADADKHDKGSLRKKTQFDASPTLDLREEISYRAEVEGVRFVIDGYIKSMGLMCDLELSLYCYDDRARLVEKIDSTGGLSKDDSTRFSKAVQTSDKFQYQLKTDFKTVKPTSKAILVFLEGGPRNFQFLQQLNVGCFRVLPETGYGNFLNHEDDTSGVNTPIFKILGKPRKNYQGMALFVYYKDGWTNEDENIAQWKAR